MFVKPGPRPDDRDRQLVVRGPNGRVLSPIGENVPDTQFWNRRLRDGDVVDACIAGVDAAEDASAAPAPDQGAAP